MKTSGYFLRSALCLLLVAESGCLIVPIPKSIPTGARVTATDTDAIKLGVTTRTEIIERLGTPQVELPALKLIAYEWDQVDYQVLYLLVGGMGGGFRGRQQSPARVIRSL